MKFWRYPPTLPDLIKFHTVVTSPARRDLTSILGWSRTNFGLDGALRYEALIDQALGDLEADPVRPGARQLQGLRANTWVYHLEYSRSHVAADRVKAPRHFIAYRIEPPVVLILRVLHDSRDLARHVPR
jgi:toxin ParE1/3/4